MPSSARVRAAFLLAALTLAPWIGCTSAPRPATPPPAAAAAAQPAALHWMRTSAEYRAAFYETYAAATRAVEAQAPSLAAGTWAVALDADETVISNLRYEKELVDAGVSYTPESWRAWVMREEAEPLPGAVAFLEGVRRLGGRIAIVTNRDQALCPATEADFRKFGIPYDVMLCKPPSEERKEARWRKVEDGTASPDLPPLHIVLWIGDNIQDFPHLSQDLRGRDAAAFADFGVRYFVLPNPLYGSWRRNPD